MQNDKIQLAAIGEHLAEQQQPMCLQKRVEQLETQNKLSADRLGVMGDLVYRMLTMMVMAGDEAEKGSLNPVKAWMFEAQEALAGKLPEQHPDDAAVDRFATAMKAKLAAAREKGRGGWDNPKACSVEFLADLLVGHVGKRNPGNFEDIANLAMMLHQRGADPAVLAGKLPVVQEGWQLVPVEPKEKMLSEAIDAGWFDEDDAAIFWASMLAAAPSPGGAK